MTQTITEIYPSFIGTDPDVNLRAARALSDLIDGNAEQTKLLDIIIQFTRLGGIQRSLDILQQTCSQEMKVRILSIISVSTNICGPHLKELLKQNIFQKITPFLCDSDPRTMFFAWHITNNILVENQDQIAVIAKAGYVSFVSQTLDLIMKESHTSLDDNHYLHDHHKFTPATLNCLQTAQHLAQFSRDQVGSVLLQKVVPFLQSCSEEVRFETLEVLTTLVQDCPPNKARFVSSKLSFRRETGETVEIDAPQAVISMLKPGLALLEDSLTSNLTIITLIQRRRVMESRKGHKSIEFCLDNEEHALEAVSQPIRQIQALLLRVFGLLNELTEDTEDPHAILHLEQSVHSILQFIKASSRFFTDFSSPESANIVASLFSKPTPLPLTPSVETLRTLITVIDDGQAPTEDEIKEDAAAMKTSPPTPTQQAVKELVTVVSPLIFSYLCGLTASEEGLDPFLNRLTPLDLHITLEEYLQTLILTVTVPDPEICTPLFQYIFNLSCSDEADVRAFCSAPLVDALMTVGNTTEQTEETQDLHSAIISILSVVVNSAETLRESFTSSKLPEKDQLRLSSLTDVMTKQHVAEYSQKFLESEDEQLVEMAETVQSFFE
ncbi:hypothetical protein BLNAU_19707 [Blattamonas nauphoetae]|uniref:Uncharacterized protein n=1 Tax=Blattamonas nauphoetae TaxID=2049346 RepID=A0ABQ9X0R6_9EUKA|nr:hypothetical protein BLNAU_19707 [Blattamonas nauphoetae]